jgi:hemerythrin
MTTQTAWQREAHAATESIEREHGLQLILVDQLAKALEQKPHDVAHRFEDLRSASDAHFMSEEVLMRQHSYPKYGAHVEEHRRLVESLADLEARYTRGEVVLEKVFAMRQWLGSHIKGMDQDFEQFMKNGP